jgi:hypothetical protein
MTNYKSLTRFIENHSKEITGLIFLAGICPIVINYFSSWKLPYPFYVAGVLLSISIPLILKKYKLHEIIFIGGFLVLILFNFSDIYNLCLLSKLTIEESKNTAIEIQDLMTSTKNSNDAENLKNPIFRKFVDFQNSNIFEKINLDLQEKLNNIKEKNVFEVKKGITNFTIANRSANSIAVSDKDNKIWIGDFKDKFNLTPINESNNKDIRYNVTDITFSSDNKHVVLGRANGVIEIIDSRERRIVARNNFIGSKIKKIFLDKDEKYLLASANNGKAYMFTLNFKENKILIDKPIILNHTLLNNEEDSEIIYSACLSSLHKIIITVGGSGSIKIWNYDGKLVNEINNQGIIYSIKINQQQSKVATYGKNGEIKIWEIISKPNLFKDLYILSQCTIDSVQKNKQYDDFFLDFYTDSNKNEALFFLSDLGYDGNKNIFNLIKFDNLKNIKLNTKILVNYPISYNNIKHLKYDFDNEQLLFLAESDSKIHTFNLLPTEKVESLNLPIGSHLKTVQVRSQNGSESIRSILLDSKGKIHTLNNELKPGKSISLSNITINAIKFLSFPSSNNSENNIFEEDKILSIDNEGNIQLWDTSDPPSDPSYISNKKELFNYEEPKLSISGNQEYLALASGKRFDIYKISDANKPDRKIYKSLRELKEKIIDISLNYDGDYVSVLWGNKKINLSIYHIDSANFLDKPYKTVDIDYASSLIFLDHSQIIISGKNGFVKFFDLDGFETKQIDSDAEKIQHIASAKHSELGAILATIDNKNLLKIWKDVLINPVKINEINLDYWLSAVTDLNLSMNGRILAIADKDHIMNIDIQTNSELIESACKYLKDYLINSQLTNDKDVKVYKICEDKIKFS